MLLWRLIKQQYDFIIRVAATKPAVGGLYIFAALESIIIPIPADPLLVATVLAGQNDGANLLWAVLWHLLLAVLVAGPWAHFYTPIYTIG